MSVFGGMDDFCNKPVLPFLVNVNLKLGKLFDILTKAKGALSFIEKILNGIVTLLNQLSNAATAAANALRLNPLASGFVKVLVTVVVAFLKGAAKVLDFAADAANWIRRAFNNSIKGYVEQLITHISKKVLLIIKIDGQIQEIVGFIQSVARFLKIQEDLGNYPAEVLKEIQTEFQKLYYAAVDELQKKVHEIEDRLEPLKSAIERIKAEIDALEAALSPMASLVAGFNNTVGYVLTQISDFAKAVKAWIDDKIAWLGWLLDGIESLIEKALDFLGVNKLIDWVKQQLGNIPFVKEAKEFSDQVKALQEELATKMQSIYDDVLAIGQQIYDGAKETVQGQTDSTLFFIIGKAIAKGLLEWVLPPRLKALIEKVRAAIGKLKEHQQGREELEGGDEVRDRGLLPPVLVSQLQGLSSDLDFVKHYALSIEGAPIKLEPLTNIFHQVSAKQELLGLPEPFVGKKRVGTAQLIERLSVQLEILSALDKDADALMAMTEAMGSEYTQELIRIVRRLSEEQKTKIEDQRSLRELLSWAASHG